MKHIGNTHAHVRPIFKEDFPRKKKCAPVYLNCHVSLAEFSSQAFAKIILTKFVKVSVCSYEENEFFNYI